MPNIDEIITENETTTELLTDLPMSIGEIITELIINSPDLLIKMIVIPLLIIAVTIIGFVLLFK